MSLSYASILGDRPATWLITGVAGFIGSNLLEALLRSGQRVVGLDNCSTGYHRNLDAVAALVGPNAWANFTFIEGDITDLPTCRRAVEGVDKILHQAALGSVPLSIDDPLRSHASNVNGFLNLLIAARDAGVKRFVYAASCASYGNSPDLPLRETSDTMHPLSLYAATKTVNELYAHSFALSYDMEPVGLRYFNIFGPRQDPSGAYAAVIPIWFDRLVKGQPVTIHGDGETSRDFCYVANVVQANLRAATVADPKALNQVYNIATGSQTSLNTLFTTIRDEVAQNHPARKDAAPVYGDFRAGDIRHSLADISKAQQLLGYAPSHTLAQGLAETTPYYLAFGA